MTRTGSFVHETRQITPNLYADDSSFKAQAVRKHIHVSIESSGDSRFGTTLGTGRGKLSQPLLNSGVFWYVFQPFHILLDIGRRALTLQ